MRLPRLWKLLFAGSAIAAGASTAAEAATAHDWSGAYLGVNVGGEKGHSKETFSPQFTATDFSGGFSGASGGVQAGYNLEHGALVYGVEGDFDYAGNKDHEVLDTSDLLFGDIDHFDHELKWFGTARARIGVKASSNIVLYGSGGLAFGDVEHAYQHQDTAYGTAFSTAAGSVSDTKAGWAAGAGAEMALNDRWSAKLEYMHLDLGDSDIAVRDTTSSVALGSAKVEDRFDTVRIGLNRKF